MQFNIQFGILPNTISIESMALTECVYQILNWLNALNPYARAKEIYTYV
jgi:hypothetical protein